MRRMLPVSLLAIALAAIAVAAPVNTTMPRDCFRTYPLPVIKLNPSPEPVSVFFAVQNFAAYPDSLFKPSPQLPPCGQNTQAARTWVEIYNARTNVRIYGHCALGAAAEMGNLGFPKPAEHGYFYIVLVDRLCGKRYRSNVVNW